MKLSGQRGQCRGINDIHQIDQQRRQVDLRAKRSAAYSPESKNVRRWPAAAAQFIHRADTGNRHVNGRAFRPFVLPAIPFRGISSATS